jgi:hypothetical protein
MAKRVEIGELAMRTAARFMHIVIAVQAVSINRRLPAPAGAKTLYQMAGLIHRRGETRVWNTILIWIMEACNFPQGFNPEINSARFPLCPRDLDFLRQEVTSITIPRQMNVWEVLVYISQEGFRAATLFELLLWWLKKPDKQSDLMTQALGSIWNDCSPCLIIDENHLCTDESCTSLNFIELSGTECQKGEEFVVVRVPLDS